jgi:hypothetical protein
MTIKQIGGVFGRNPTFNDVVVDDEITVNGSADINGNADISGTLSFPDLSIVGTGNAIYTNTTGAAFFRSSQMLFQNAAGTVGYATINSNGIVMPNGLGIDFSATAGTGTSELFDDYEEGTWTPTFQGTTSGSISFASEGYYTKIGRMVMASFYLTSKDFSAAAIVGTLEIAGLPFNVAILGQGLGNLAVNNFIAGASDYVPYAYSTDRLRVSKGSTSTVTDADLTQSASRAIAVSITYMSS